MFIITSLFFRFEIEAEIFHLNVASCHSKIEALLVNFISSIVGIKLSSFLKWNLISVKWNTLTSMTS